MNKISQKVKLLIERVKESLLAALVALLISSFIICHTYVPTESMMYTINPGEHFFVYRLPYYYRNPIRSEIAVFNYKGERFIKRVVGMPGDEINIIDNQVYINGQVLDESRYLAEDTKTFLYSASVIEFPYKIPKDYYFMMGDNRTNSTDSRVFGPIPRKDIVAKAGCRIFPLNQVGFVE